MARHDPISSRRFTRAARVERGRLIRAGARLARRRDDLRSRLEAVDADLADVEEQLGLIEGLTEGSAAETAGSDAAPVTDGRLLLHGAAIREVAVPLLLRTHGSAPVHYRDWYQLLRAEGHEVSGKRPDAVFLGQVARSPLVRSTTKAGFYLVDPDIAAGLRSALTTMQLESAELLAEVATDAVSLAAQRRRRHELSLEISRAERRLAEALAAIEQADPGLDRRSPDPS